MSIPSHDSASKPLEERAHEPAPPQARATPTANTGLFQRRILNTLGYSLQGLRWAFRHEEAFRLEVIAFVVLAPTGIYLAATALEAILLLTSLVLVMIVELLNTAVEKTIDRFSHERHPTAKIAKDIGSAAVLLAIGLAIVIWLVILL